MDRCKEYTCEAHGGAECPLTRILLNDPDWECEGPFNCESCLWMNSSGERSCTVGDHASSHFCEYAYKSGFERREE